MKHLFKVIQAREDEGLNSGELLSVINKLRPSHRKQYIWLLTASFAIQVGAEMEDAMSKYTGMYMYDPQAEYESLVSEFGAKFQQSLVRFIHSIYSHYGYEAVSHLCIWESGCMPNFLYARMMDESHREMHRMIQNNEIPY